MKFLFFGSWMCTLLLSNFSCYSQTPQGIPYQAIARNSSGGIIASHTIGVRYTIHDSIATGATIYQETFSPTTNTLGLFNVNVGMGSATIGTFSNINWERNAKFMQVELDAAGGTSYVDMGTTQMMSVPYAFFSKKSAAANYLGNYCGTVSGTANVLIATSPANIGNLTEGLAISFKAAASNTGPATINVDGLGAVSLTKNGTSALAAGDLAAGVIYTAQYDGDGFQVLNVRQTSSVSSIGLTYSNLKIQVTSSSTLDITANEVVLKDGSGNPYIASNVSLTNNLSSTGVNGLDAGSLAASTWYYVYLISNGSTVKSLVSISSVSPSLPSGYSFRRRVGAIRINSSTNLMYTLQVGNTVQYIIGTNPSAPTPYLTIASGGGSFSTAISVSALVPPTSVQIGVVLWANGPTSQGCGIAPNSHYSEGLFTDNTNNYGGGCAGFMVLESSNVYYTSSGYNNVCWCYAWVDGL